MPICLGAYSQESVWSNMFLSEPVLISVQIAMPFCRLKVKFSRRAMPCLH